MQAHDHTKFDTLGEVITAEASSLGYRPGIWPTDFQVKLPSGIKALYVFSRSIHRDGELVAKVYTTQSPGGREIHILND